MGSRIRNTSTTVLALAALGVGVCCTYAFGCGSNSSSSSPTDAGPTLTSGPKPDAGNLQCTPDPTDWPMFGQNVCNTNSQASSGQIGVDTVGTLGVKWVWGPNSTPPTQGDFSATPTVVGGSVYIPDWGGYISRLDANTGAVTWTKKIDDLLASAGDAGSQLTGFVSRNAPIVTNGSVIFGTFRNTSSFSMPGPQAYLLALDQNTGAVKWVTLVDPHRFAGLVGSAALDGTTIYQGVSSSEEFGAIVETCCTFRGSVVAVDVTTGLIKWQTHTISDALYYANDAGKLSGYAGVSIWSSTPAIDRERRQIYVTTGNNYHYGSKGAEAGAAQGNYVDGVIALDMDTGAIKWGQSLPEDGQDLWTLSSSNGPDSDFGAGANLFTTTINGQLTDVVGAGQKSGVYYAFDPNTGAILWKRQVAPGGHLGGIHWGTATDGLRIYTESNFNTMDTMDKPFTLAGMGAQAGNTAATGTWSALDPATGDILWQIVNPALPDGPQGTASCNGPVAVVNGVLFAGSMDTQGTMFAFNAATGDVLWSYQSGGTVYGGPAISNGVVYWGSGFPSNARPLGFGSTSMQLYAFALGLGGDGGTEAGSEGGAGPSSDAGPEASADAGSE